MFQLDKDSDEINLVRKFVDFKVLKVNNRIESLFDAVINDFLRKKQFSRMAENSNIYAIDSLVIRSIEVLGKEMDMFIESKRNVTDTTGAMVAGTRADSIVYYKNSSNQT